MKHLKTLALVLFVLSALLVLSGCLSKEEADAVAVAIAQLDKDIAVLPPEAALPLLNAKAHLLIIQSSDDSIWGYIGAIGVSIGFPGLVLVLKRLVAYRASLIGVVNAVQQAKIGSNESTYTLSKDVLRDQLNNDTLVQKVLKDVRDALAKDASAAAIKNS